MSDFIFLEVILIVQKSRVVQNGYYFVFVKEGTDHDHVQNINVLIDKFTKQERCFTEIYVTSFCTNINNKIAIFILLYLKLY